MQRYIQCIFGVLSPKALRIMNDPRFIIVNARMRETYTEYSHSESRTGQKCYLECMFLVLKGECPKAENTMDILRPQSVRAIRALGCRSFRLQVDSPTPKSWLFCEDR